MTRGKGKIGIFRGDDDRYGLSHGYNSDSRGRTILVQGLEKRTEAEAFLVVAQEAYRCAERDFADEMRFLAIALDEGRST